MKKSLAATVIFSMVPGGGHMYLGWMNRGLQLMLSFFVCIFLIDWLGLSLFGFLLPVIWFYSFFEALQIHSGGKTAAEEDAFPVGRLADKQRWLGLGLIVIGAIALINKALFPLLVRYVDPYLNYYTLRTVLVSLLFIAGGIWLLRGKPLARSGHDQGAVDTAATIPGEEE